MGILLPSAWNGSWDDPPNNPSAVRAISAMAPAIRAARALSVRGRPSCNRQVIDRNPGRQQQARLTFSWLRSVTSRTLLLAGTISDRRFRAHLVDVRADVSSHAEVPIRCGSC